MAEGKCKFQQHFAMPVWCFLWDNGAIESNVNFRKVYFWWALYWLLFRFLCVCFSLNCGNPGPSEVVACPNYSLKNRCIPCEILVCLFFLECCFQASQQGWNIDGFFSVFRQAYFQNLYSLVVWLCANNTCCAYNSTPWYWRSLFIYICTAREAPKNRH